MLLFMNNQLLHFSFRNAHVRGALAQTTDSYQELIEQHGNQAPYPLFVKHLLGEMASILLLMVSNLKLTGKMNLQIRGSGHLYSAFTEVQLNGETPIEMRGIARRQEESQPTSLDLRDWVGANASLAITLIPDQGQSYQGLVPIDYPRLVLCIEDYYERSEQIPTKLWTQVSDTGCAALMVQHLPGNDASQGVTPEAGELQIDLETAATLATTLSPDELILTDPELMLHRLFHEYPTLIHGERAIHYKCSCSPERMTNALISLGIAELQRMAAEDPVITMDCQFCGADQTFDANAIMNEIKKDF